MQPEISNENKLQLDIISCSKTVSYEEPETAGNDFRVDGDHQRRVLPKLP